MKTRTRVGIGLFLLGVMILGVVGIVYNVKFVVPQETISQAAWIPGNAEIRSSTVVEPGTFKIQIPLKELQDTTTPDQRVLVVYRVNVPSEKTAVTYYRENAGGTFHYTHIVMPDPPSKPWLEALSTGWAVTFDEKNATFQSTLVKEYWGVFAGSIMAILGGGAMFLWFSRVASWVDENFF